MTTGYILLIFKKSDRIDCANYREIWTTNSIMKISGTILRNNLKEWLYYTKTLH